MCKSSGGKKVYTRLRQGAQNAYIIFVHMHEVTPQSKCAPPHGRSSRREAPNNVMPHEGEFVKRRSEKRQRTAALHNLAEVRASFPGDRAVRNLGPAHVGCYIFSSTRKPI